MNVRTIIYVEKGSSALTMRVRLGQTSVIFLSCPVSICAFLSLRCIVLFVVFELVLFLMVCIWFLELASQLNNIKFCNLQSVTNLYPPR